MAINCERKVVDASLYFALRSTIIHSVQFMAKIVKMKLCYQSAGPLEIMFISRPSGGQKVFKN